MHKIKASPNQTSKTALGRLFCGFYALRTELALPKLSYRHRKESGIHVIVSRETV